MAERARGSKTKRGKRTRAEKEEVKKEGDRARNKTRINIGSAFERWRVLRELIGFRLDAELATFLLDR